VIDALGQPQSLLLLGGTSELALAIARELPADRLRRVVLAGRDAAGLAHAAGTLATHLPSAAIETVLLDAGDPARHGPVVDAVFDAGDVDVTVLAIGALGDQAAAEQDPALALALITATYTGPVSLLLHTARRLRRQGHGVLVVLSSVAGRQARRSNYLYGSAKAGLDLAALGVHDTLHGTGARLLVVRPGFVRTRMTAHLAAPPLATTAPEVARAVVRGIRQRRTVVYAPAAARAVALLLTVLPRPVLRRLPF
jgi:decaprenylphospho-beta-D-erythro-pentofuranosid-2-ulose 2-reductase